MFFLKWVCLFFEANLEGLIVLMQLYGCAVVTRNGSMLCNSSRCRWIPFSGSEWDDPRIGASNPDMGSWNLTPAQPIEVVVLKSSSGKTEIFIQRSPNVYCMQVDQHLHVCVGGCVGVCVCVCVCVHVCIHIHSNVYIHMHIYTWMDI